MSTPYIGFTNDTLSRQPEVRPGDTFTCEHCGELHSYESPAARWRPGDSPPLLLFYRCQGNLCLGAVDGRSVLTAKADVSGALDLTDEGEN